MTFDLINEDIEQLKELHDESLFPFPDFSNPLYCINRVVKDIDGNIKGSYFVKITSETGLILDPSLSNLEKARIIKGIFKDLNEKFKKLGLDDTHVYVVPEEDNSYSDFLVKNLGFKKDSGISLFRRTEHE